MTNPLFFYVRSSFEFLEMEQMACNCEMKSHWNHWKEDCKSPRLVQESRDELSFSWELGIYYSFNFGFEHNLVWYCDMMCSFSLNAATWRKIINTLLSIWHALSVVHKAMVAWTQFNHFQFQANNRNHP